MKRYILRRLFYGLITLFIVSLVVFLLVRVSGDPVYLLIEPDAPAKDVAALRAALGLDKPLAVQYLVYMKQLLVGDFGKSFVYGLPIRDLFLERLPASLQLIGLTIVFAVGFGVLIGVLSALKVGGWVDTFGKPFAFLGLSIPSFWLGLMLMLLFAVHWRILPAAGQGGVANLVMPVACLAWYKCASYVRLTRSSLLDVLGSQYITFLRIKGLPERTVVGKHALKNSLIPVVGFAGIQIVLLIQATVVVEIVFAWPGIGSFLYEAIMHRDYPIVQMTVLLIAILMILTNMLVDILYAYLDPRIRLR